MRRRVLVNATGSRSGGGRVYVLAMLEELGSGGARDLEWVFLVDAGVEPLHPAPMPGVQLRARSAPTLARIAWEQTALPLRARRERFDVLVSAANFAPLLYPWPHVLVQQNPLYFSGFELEGRRGARHRVETALARASVERATATVTATEAMARIVAERTGREPTAIPFGPGLVTGAAPGPREPFTFLHRTTWHAHKRFGDLLLAVRELAESHGGRFVVRSACDPRTEFAHEFAESERDRELLADPAIASHVEL